MTQRMQGKNGDRRGKPAQILDEAIRIVGERGYYGFSVQELAARCGLTTAGLLYHFKTKEELFLAVLRERDERAQAALIPLLSSIPAESLSGDRVPLDLVFRLLRAMIEMTVAQPELSRLFVVLGAEALYKLHPGHTYFREREEYVITMLTRLVRPHVANPLATARQISALMLGLQRQWLGSDGAWDLVAEWDQAIAAVLPDISETAAVAR